MIRQSRRILLSALVLLLGACSILPKSNPLTVYQLPAAHEATAPVFSGLSTRSLIVFTPYANSFLDADRITVIPSGNRLSVYEGSRWGDQAPVVFRSRLVQDFRKTTDLKAVGNERENLLADYQLRGDLTAFQVEYRNEQPTAVIAFDVSLTDGQSGRVIASHHFSVTEVVDGSQVPEVVQAFGRASTRINHDIIQWVYQVAGK
ncbi:membrane integrity-associated transporter subunit PqiC [Advenella sp. WQ 585]|uniref:Membrane integrity-associated transporter subunit PqiC n=1 Tax=Advenella mandrilli TaxID=2800330 RepID=A0ABS1EHH6_9BURK|nr:ABC-type transport auxiliary lipoprotein family protein [Advenella mandrilli]MBK1782455.1 membrane integrity-associated transporter subunit PqiC [Advenella mandrilli]